jgi:hypothetical protein
VDTEERNLLTGEIKRMFSGLDNVKEKISIEDMIEGFTTHVENELLHPECFRIMGEFVMERAETMEAFGLWLISIGALIYACEEDKAPDVSMN